MAYLKQPKKRPEYRGERDHETFLARLKDHLDSLTDLQNGIIVSLGSVFDLEEAEPEVCFQRFQQLLSAQQKEQGKSIDEIIKTVYI